MAFYLLFLFLITLLIGLTYLFTNKSNFFQIILLVLALAVAGFRDGISGDFKSYVNWYINKTRDNDFEFGFVLIMNLFRWFNLNYHILFFFFSFFTIFFIFLGVKKYTKHSNLAFLFFLLIPALYLNSWSIIRQSFAVSIGFCAFYYLINKKYLIYVVLMGIGISVHYSAIVPFFVFVGVYKYADRIRIMHIVVLLFLSLILSQFYWFYIFTHFFEKTHYVAYFSSGNTHINPNKIIVLNCLGVFLLFYWARMKEVFPIQKYFIVLSLFSIIITNLFATANDLNRFSNYFTVFEIVVFSDIIFLEFKERRGLLLTGLYLYGVSLFLYTIKADYNLNNQGTKYIPYNSVFYKFDSPFFMYGVDYLGNPSIDKK
ncbi:EpsG family protein [Flavobacterium sp.]|uniref:EpsG family protein n=1 Tax=Flavobacterium sp. TaxID=239 RepID=UPI002BF0CA6B|nr:EpsG family protein [Flavobacterium sp.]HSD07336.1 EpsG family protein [Flavobacterium sp.]